MKHKMIRVALEMSPDKFKKLIETITMGRKILSEEELDRLAKAGKVRAADYLNASEAAVLAGLFSSFSSQLKNGLLSAKLSNGVRNVILGKGDIVVATVSVERVIPLEDDDEDSPKE